MKTKFLSLLLALVFLLSLVGCGVDINAVGLPETMTMEKDTTLQMEINYGTSKPAEAAAIKKASSDLVLVWTSDNEAVATVDNNGLVTALAGGQANIMVTIQDSNLSSICAVDVTVTPIGVSVDNTMNLQIDGQETGNVNAEMIPADATNSTIKYSSSDENVATVSEDGTVTAIGNGECAILTDSGYILIA